MTLCKMCTNAFRLTYNVSYTYLVGVVSHAHGMQACPKIGAQESSLLGGDANQAAVGTVVLAPGAAKLQARRRGHRSSSVPRYEQYGFMKKF